MVTKLEYLEAMRQIKRGYDTMKRYHQEQDDAANKRWSEFENGRLYTEGELSFAWFNCSCGAIMAYPHPAPTRGSYLCSRVLLGEVVGESAKEHTDLPIVMNRSMFSLPSDKNIDPKRFDRVTREEMNKVKRVSVDVLPPMPHSGSR